METGEELFRAAAWGQHPHTVDTSVPLPLWNKAQDSCPDACPPSARGSRPARPPPSNSPGQQPGYLASGRMMKPGQDCAQGSSSSPCGPTWF